ncbi:MAG: hypothetical protein ACKOVB_22075, partial [Terrabacter sp.]
FTTLTRSVTLAHPTAEADQLRDAAAAALTAANPVEPVRLLGVSLSGLTPWAQLRLPENREGVAVLDSLHSCGVLTESPSATTDSHAPVATGDENHAPDAATLEGAVGPLPGDEDPDEADEDQLPAPLTLHTVAIGLDVFHPDHGSGWVARADDGVVTVRFEGPDTPPGPERKFDIRRELLMRVAPPEPCPPPRLTSLASLGDVEAITAMLLPNEATFTAP